MTPHLHIFNYLVGRDVHVSGLCPVRFGSIPVHYTGRPISSDSYTLVVSRPLMSFSYRRSGPTDSINNCRYECHQRSQYIEDFSCKLHGLFSVVLGNYSTYYWTRNWGGVVYEVLYFIRWNENELISQWWIPLRCRLVCVENLYGKMCLLFSSLRVNRQIWCVYVCGCL